MKKRGSAIVIAILLITAIGGIAFSFGRIFLLEAANASLYENGIGAYYSAESGIEEGFLRYRYNMNTEVPFDNWKLGEKKVYSYNLTNLTCSSPLNSCDNDGIDKVSYLSDPSKQTYDLRMGFIGTDNKSPYYGQNINAIGLDKNDINSEPPSVEYGTGLYSYLTIPKDQAFKIDLGNFDFSAGKDIDFYAKFVKFNDADIVSEFKSIAELKLVYNASDGSTKEVKTMISRNPALTCLNVFGRGDLACSSEFITAQRDADGTNSVNWEVPDLISKIKGATNLPGFLPPPQSIALYIKPLFYNMKIGLTTDGFVGTDKTNIVPGPYTNIFSTGYYGGVARTLEASIDRQSGTLYDLFDYVIYKKN